MSSQGTNSPGQSIERRRFVDKLLSAPVGAAAASVMLAIFMGCMSLSIGCTSEPEGTICQEGKVSARAEQELDVYYPVPYASPPNLEISGDSYEVIEQKADHFRIRNTVINSGNQWSWKSRGLRGLPPGAAPTVIVTPPSPPPDPLPTNGTPAPLPAPTPVQTP